MKCYGCYHRCEACDTMRHHWEKTQKDSGRKLNGGFVPDNSSLCWCCQHAWDQDCSWQDHKEPVPYWKAKRRILDGRITYNVERCPNFERRIPSWLKEKTE